MAQLVRCPTLDFGLGHDLTVRGIEPRTGLCADSAESAWDSLSPSALPPLKINKLKKQKQHEIAELLRIRTEVPCASESRYILKNKNSVYFRSL